jgi:hypothetical protein
LPDFPFAGSCFSVFWGSSSFPTFQVTYLRAQSVNAFLSLSTLTLSHGFNTISIANKPQIYIHTPNFPLHPGLDFQLPTQHLYSTCYLSALVSSAWPPKFISHSSGN